MTAREILQPSPETVIWRYMNFEKFKDLISSRGLFFAQAKRFYDPSEGSLTMADIGAVFGDMAEALAETYDDPAGPRAYTIVSCWHMNTIQTAHMWGTYAGSGGVAIQSTVKKLHESLGPRNDILSGMINYGVRPSPGLGEGEDLRVVFFHKSPEFESDREYRLLRYDYSLINRPRLSGAYTPAHLETLIEKVYVMTTPDFPMSQVTDLLAEHAVNVLVEKSTLFDRRPF